MPVRLRGHRFLCILTYRGVGYRPAFVEKMTGIVSAIGRGRKVVPVDGPDDICNGLTPEYRRTCDHDCAKPSTVEMDLFASDAVRALLPLRSGLKPVGEGVSEWRIDWGPGIRIYVAFDGLKLIILLGGGSKNRREAIHLKVEPEPCVA